ncbi:hypothetical protein V9K10_000784 [Vibrio cholerae]|nr:hypothetical protein [Vibrio cholerae]
MSSNFDLVDKQLSLVIVGAFHALNFTNDWLKYHELMHEDDFRASETKVHNGFHMETSLPWSTIQVMPHDRDRNRLTITLTDPAMFSQFVDLTTSICTMFSTTLVTALGINFLFLTKHKDQDSWDEFGHRLLPPPTFSRVFNPDETKCRVGMNNCSIKFVRLLESVIELDDDELFTELNVTVKPVYYDANGERIYFSTETNLNYHFPMPNNLGMDAVYQTLQVYLAQLNESVDEQVMKFVRGD